MSDSEKVEERNDAPDEKTEERKAPEVKVVAEPEPQLEVESRTVEPHFGSLSDAFEKRGFFESGAASVSWDEYRSFTYTPGTVTTNINPNQADSAPFGYDQRWLYPALPNVAVSAETTSVTYLQQTARTLAAGTLVVRPIDAVSTKPETSSTADFKTLDLSQIASVQSGIPRIHAAQPLFASLVETDLRLAIGDGLDQLVRTGVNTAGTSAAVTGTVPLDKVRKAITVVNALGYSPNVLAIDPAGAEALDLQKSEGSEKIYTFPAGASAPAPYGLQVRVWKSAGTAVIDSRAFGKLYVAPMELRSFEADAGTSNKQNVRLETNAGFAVERATAALRII